MLSPATDITYVRAKPQAKWRRNRRTHTQPFDETYPNNPTTADEWE